MLAGGAGAGTVLAAAVALSLFYVGGMWLNDAFDAEIDARERAGRPIPQGDVDRGTVFAGGFAFLGAGVVAGFALGLRAGAVALALAAAIVAVRLAAQARSPRARSSWGRCAFSHTPSAALRGRRLHRAARPRRRRPLRACGRPDLRRPAGGLRPHRPRLAARGPRRAARLRAVPRGRHPTGARVLARARRRHRGGARGSCSAARAATCRARSSR